MRFEPDWVVHPGATLREWFEEMKLPYSVAGHYNISEKTLQGIFDGTQEIDDRLAMKLCNLTHIGGPMWRALEHNFREGLAAGKRWDPDG